MYKSLKRNHKRKRIINAFGVQVKNNIAIVNNSPVDKPVVIPKSTIRKMINLFLNLKNNDQKN